MKMRRAKALLRVSSNYSDVKRQRNDLARLQKEHHLEIVGDPVELHGVSGTATLKHADVQRVLWEIEQPGVDGLMTSAIDRLARPKEGKDYAILDGFRQKRKFLWTKDEGELRLWVPAVWADAMNALTRAYLELCKIRDRSMDGKRAKREIGLNVNGPAVVPRGLRYQRIADAAGRTLDGKWSYDEDEVAKVDKAYALLFEDRYLLSEIERMVGWPRAHIKTLRYPCWKGVMIYQPAREDEETMEVALPLKPRLSPDEWELAQKLLLKRRTWSRATAERRFLAAGGLLICECQRAYYVQPETGRGRHDHYFCSSRLYPPRCGARQLRRAIVDGIIERLVVEHLTDARFLAGLLAQVEEPTVPHADDREKELAKLAARRKKWILEFDQDHITKQEFEERMDALKKAVREVEARIPVVSRRSLDQRAVVDGVVDWALDFGKIPDFEEKRRELKRVVKKIQVLDGHIATFDVSGAFLGSSNCIKDAQQYSALSTRCCFVRCRTPAPTGWSG
jgi:DNA invertase Pin-like site-specific DNA recombinase